MAEYRLHRREASIPILNQGVCFRAYALNLSRNPTIQKMADGWRWGIPCRNEVSAFVIGKIPLACEYNQISLITTAAGRGYPTGVPNTDLNNLHRFLNHQGVC